MNDDEHTVSLPDNIDSGPLYMFFELDLPWYKRFWRWVTRRPLVTPPTGWKKVGRDTWRSPADEHTPDETPRFWWIPREDGYLSPGLHLRIRGRYWRILPLPQTKATRRTERGGS